GVSGFGEAPRARASRKRRGRRPCGRRPSDREVVPRASDLANVRRLQALRAPRDVELDSLALGERLEAIALDGREVHEHVLAARLRDETKALRLVEPLHGATSHLKLLETGPGGPTTARSRCGRVRSL